MKYSEKKGGACGQNKYGIQRVSAIQEESKGSRTVSFLSFSRAFLNYRSIGIRRYVLSVDHLDGIVLVAGKVTSDKDCSVGARS